jgi:hypothetical protein
MVEASENWCSMHRRERRRLRRREPSLTSGRLQAETTMGSPVVVMRVLAQQSLSLAVVPDEQVVEALAPKRADDALAVRVGSRRSRWRKELSNTEAAHTTSKRGAIHAIPIVQEETWRHSVADRFDHALGYPLSRRMRSDADVHDLPAFEPEDHKSVEHVEAETHNSEEVARPGSVRRSARKHRSRA